MKILENIKKFRAMTTANLEKELKSVQKEYTMLSLKVKVGKEKNVSASNKLKKDIARIKTILFEKEYGVENE